MINMIASVGRNMEIGKNNNLIWRIPKDMKFFKNVTMGHDVLMGRKTFESLPGPLPGRRMLVLTSSEDLKSNYGIIIVNSISEVLNKYENTNRELYVIGGETLYCQFIDNADNLYLTEIDAEMPDADNYFPKIKYDEWDKMELYRDRYKELDYEICKYKKKVRKITKK